MCGVIEVEAYSLMTEQFISVWCKDDGTGSLRLISVHNRAAPARMHLLYSSVKKHYELLRFCSNEHATALTESSSAGSKTTEVPAAPLDCLGPCGRKAPICCASRICHNRCIRLSRPGRRRGIVTLLLLRLAGVSAFATRSAGAMLRCHTLALLFVGAACVAEPASVRPSACAD
eukprot:3980291-Prymnesium_polylepis.1